MKKYMIVALVPILLQGALLQSSEAEFNQAIAPSLQNARALLKNSMISADLDSVLNGLIESVKNGTISSRVALDKISDIRNALVAFKNKQYSTTWQWLFGAKPQIVQDKLDPAFQAINKSVEAINIISDKLYKVLGIVAGSIAGAAALGTAVYAGYQWNKGKGKRQYHEAVGKPLAEMQARNAARKAAQAQAAAASTSSSSVSSGDSDEDDAEEDAQIAKHGFAVSTLSEAPVQPLIYYDECIFDLPQDELRALQERVEGFGGLSLDKAIEWAKKNSKHAQAFVAFYQLNHHLDIVVDQRPVILDNIKTLIKPDILQRILAKPGLTRADNMSAYLYPIYQSRGLVR